MASKFSKKWIIITIVLVVGGILGYKYWMSRQSALPAGIASGNGRIEAKLTDASAKEPLRVKSVLVDEGDLVKPGQVLVQLDTSTLDEELAKNQAAVASAREDFAAANSAIAEATADIAAAKAEIAGAKAQIAGATADVASANAAIEQQQSEVQLAQTEADRQSRMLAENATSKAVYDVRQTALLTTKATLKGVQSRAEAAQAQVGAAQAKEGAAQAKEGAARARAATAKARADAAQQQIGVAQGQVAVTKSRIKDATLVSPVTGRVLYRLVQPGEVVAAGGKALTIVDLSDVYMEIFVPSDQAARLKTGAPARITVDYEPNAAAAGYVSFVSPEAQFTPKQVETKTEREKLMFRVKIQIPSELVTHYVERIKTGVRGVGYVQVNPDAKWPDWLERGLINPTTKTSALQSFPSSMKSN
jgi:HlyD family secretion protein